MIMIKARGARDVRTLRRIASELSATSVEVSQGNIAMQEMAPATQRQGRRPLISTLPGATISVQTQAALLELMPVEVEKNGEYDLR